MTNKAQDFLKYIGKKIHASIEKNAWVFAFEVAIMWVILAFFGPGGDDLYRYYIPFQNGCDTCGFVPFFARWFLWPLALLPAYPWSWGIWVLISLGIFLLLIKWTKVNPFLFIVSMPLFGQLWLGQIDWLIALGLLILLFVKNDFLRGFGLLLALVKPQLTFLAIIVLLVQERPRNLAKIAVIPALALLLSLQIFGLNWIQRWIENAMISLPPHQWRLAGMDIWRYGIFLIWVPFLFKERRMRVAVGLMISSIATPFFGVYSYVLFLMLVLPSWTVPLSYAWILGAFWFGEDAMRLAWILPLTLVGWSVYQAYWAEKLFLFGPSSGHD